MIVHSGFRDDSRVVHIDANAMLIDQPAAEIRRQRDEHGGQECQKETPALELFTRGAEAQQPVQRGEREHHHRDDRVAPGGDLASNFGDGNQVDDAGEASDAAAKGADADEPEAGTLPERVSGPEESEISGHEANQGRNRKVNHHGMQRMAGNGRAAIGRGWRKLGHVNLLVPSGCRAMKWTLAIGATVPLLVGCEGPQAIVDPAGPMAREVTRIWWAMFAFATVVLFAVTAIWIYAMRRKPRDYEPEHERRIHRRWIIGGGIILPTVSIALLLMFGIPAGHRMLPLPVEGEQPLRVEVIGHQWWWEIRYPESGVVTANELHLPAGRPIDVEVSSADVIHSFWVPRLGGKIDMFPGMTNTVRLQADEPGQHRGQCAEFCGTQHAHMVLYVQVHDEAGFEAWQESMKP